MLFDALYDHTLLREIDRAHVHTGLRHMHIERIVRQESVIKATRESSSIGRNYIMPCFD
jgi:hypothetical protein